VGGVEIWRVREVERWNRDRLKRHAEQTTKATRKGKA